MVVVQSIDGGAEYSTTVHRTIQILICKKCIILLLHNCTLYVYTIPTNYIVFSSNITKCKKIEKKYQSFSKALYLYKKKETCHALLMQSHC